MLFSTKLKSVSLIALTLLWFGCKPSEEQSALDAIGTGDGRAAFGFIPVLELSTPEAKSKYSKVRSEFPNYFQMPFFALVTCEGNADIKFSQLEEKAWQLDLRVNRMSSEKVLKLRSSDGKAINNGCQIKGKYFLTAPVVISWFAKMNGLQTNDEAAIKKSIATFLKVQTLYLSVRGPSSDNPMHKTNIIKLFDMINMTEGNELNRPSSDNAYGPREYSKFIAKYDPIFNPCFKEVDFPIKKVNYTDYSVGGKCNYKRANKGDGLKLWQDTLKLVIASLEQDHEHLNREQMKFPSKTDEIWFRFTKTEGFFASSNNAAKYIKSSSGVGLTGLSLTQSWWRRPGTWLGNTAYGQYDYWSGNQAQRQRQEAAARQAILEKERRSIQLATAVERAKRTQNTTDVNRAREAYNNSVNSFRNVSQRLGAGDDFSGQRVLTGDTAVLSRRVNDLQVALFHQQLAKEKLLNAKPGEYANAAQNFRDRSTYVDGQRGATRNTLEQQSGYKHSTPIGSSAAREWPLPTWNQVRQFGASAYNTVSNSYNTYQNNQKMAQNVASNLQTMGTNAYNNISNAYTSSFNTKVNAVTPSSKIITSSGFTALGTGSDGAKIQHYEGDAVSTKFGEHWTHNLDGKKTNYYTINADKGFMYPLNENGMIQKNMLSRAGTDITTRLKGLDSASIRAQAAQNYLDSGLFGTDTEQYKSIQSYTQQQTNQARMNATVKSVTEKTSSAIGSMMSDPVGTIKSGYNTISSGFSSLMQSPKPAAPKTPVIQNTAPPATPGPMSGAPGAGSNGVPVPFVTP